MDMDYMAIYTHRNDQGLVLGRVSASFRHNPPTETDITDMETEISEKFCSGNPCMIVNLIKITPEVE